MKRQFISAGVAVIALAAPAVAGAGLLSAGSATGNAARTVQQEDSHDDRAADKAAIDQNLAAQHAAWFNQDGAAFAATFHNDADVVTFNGDHLRGRQHIAEAMQYYFDNFIDPSTIRILDEQPVRWLEPDLASIVRTTCFVPEGTTECRPDSLTRNINVYVKREGVWKQMTFQNSRVFSFS